MSDMFLLQWDLKFKMSKVKLIKRFKWKITISVRASMSTLTFFISSTLSLMFLKLAGLVKIEVTSSSEFLQNKIIIISNDI